MRKLPSQGERVRNSVRRYPTSVGPGSGGFHARGLRFRAVGDVAPGEPKTREEHGAQESGGLGEVGGRVARGRPSGNDTPLGPVQEGLSSSLIMMELQLFSQRFSDLEPD